MFDLVVEDIVKVVAVFEDVENGVKVVDVVEGVLVVLVGSGECVGLGTVTKISSSTTYLA